MATYPEPGGEPAIIERKPGGELAVIEPDEGVFTTALAARIKRVEDRGDELQTKISELKYTMDKLEQELRRLQRSVEQNTNALKQLRTRGD